MEVYFPSTELIPLFPYLGIGGKKGENVFTIFFFKYGIKPGVKLNQAFF